MGSSGIVFIGVGLADRYITLNGFRELIISPRIPAAPFLFSRSVETGYTWFFEEKNKWAYGEGILSQAIYPDKAPEDIEPALKDWMIRVAQQVEKDHCESHQRGREWARQNEIPHDFPVHYQQLAKTDLGAPGSELVWEPHYRVLATGREEDIEQEYARIASDLVLKTKEARITRFKEKQRVLTERSLARIADTSGRNLF